MTLLGSLAEVQLFGEVDLEAGDAGVEEAVVLAGGPEPVGELLVLGGEFPIVLAEGAVLGGHALDGVGGQVEFKQHRQRGMLRTRHQHRCDPLPGCGPPYERDNGTQMTWSGDSGSPVYTLNEDGNAEVHGTHVGLARTSYGGGAETFTHYATKYSTIRYSFGGYVRSW